MKIRRLTFKNLNSLAGEWSIDFTAPEYECEGIFAITGPTGAGKSTILDAICLALFGQTPRLGKITANANEIMSRQTGDCFAELLFSTVKGEFLVHWSQRRSRDKAEGKLQAPKHEVSEAVGGKVIENMLSRVSGVVEGLCGMDFERFTRSSMLAQGSFAKFLESNANERAPILEQITGTGIYSELSILVHERKGEEDAKAKSLKDQLEGAVLLDGEELEEMKEEQAALSGSYGKLKAELAKLRAAEGWLSACEREGKELARIEVGLIEHGRKVEDFAGEAKLLGRAQEARAMETIYLELIRLRGEEKGLRERIASSEAQIKRSKQAAELHLVEKHKHEEELRRAKELRAEAAPKIRRATELQSELAGKKAELAKARENLTEILKHIDKEGKNLARLEAEHGREEKEQAASLLFLEKNPGLEGLAAAYSGLCSRLGHWRDASREQKKRRGELAEIGKRIGLLEEEETALREKKRAAGETISLKEKEYEKEEKDVSGLLGGMTVGDSEKHLEKLERRLEVERRIVSLSAERAKLVEGMECPLCGAKEHPFSSGEVAAEAHVSATESEVHEAKDRMKRFAVAEKALAGKRMELEKERAGLGLLEERWKSHAAKIDAERRRRDELSAEIEEIHGRLRRTREEIAGELKGFGFVEEEFGDSAALLENLAVKRDAWERHREKTRSWKERKALRDTEAEHLRKVLREQNARKEEVERGIAAFRTGIDRALHDQKEIIGEAGLAEYAEGFEQGVETAEEKVRITGLQWSKSANEVLAVETLADARRAELEEVCVKRETQEEKFLAEAKGRGFSDEEEFSAARLSEEHFNQLLETSDALAAAGRDLKTREEQTKTRLKELRENQLSEKQLEDLRQDVEAANEKFEETGKALGALDQKLRQDAEAREKLAEKRDQLAKQEKECARWSSLHRLIGSSDGKKFRNFAQGLTFELMVRHANRQLGKMNDRYQLIRAEGSPLDLEVIDAYQAGEIRSTRNLSGGESFIISLSLALGLSRMASEKVRVDSLFLDEGFGTLDEEALDTALGALASLNGEGKLIGLISHVPALKERISTQLTLESGRNGRSVLAGPGVRS